MIASIPYYIRTSLLYQMVGMELDVLQQWVLTNAFLNVF